MNSETNNPNDEGEKSQASHLASHVTRNLKSTMASTEGEGDFQCESLLFPMEIGRYEAVDEIAQGGMGIILRAWDPTFCREVAIKVLQDQHMKTPMVSRFRFEAQLTARLQHPGIVPVYDLGQMENGRPYFVMKLIQGNSFQTQLEEEPGNLSKHLKVFERVCQTLAYCHSQGVVHLDIKPANVMVGEFGEVQLMDWGLANIHGDDLGTTSPVPARLDIENYVARRSKKTVIQGTPAYMAPEQAAGNHYGIRTDVFGLGAMLYEILTGHPPYVGEQLRSIYAKATLADLNDELAALTERCLDQPMVRLAQRCLAKNPMDRPANADEVATVVTAYLDAKLLEGMDDWHHFFEISRVLFCVASYDGFFLRVNKNFSKVLGYTEEELIARPFLDFVHSDDHERTVEIMTNLLHGKPIFEFRNRYRHAQGHYLVLEWTAKPMLEERRIYAVAHDVTSSMPSEASTITGYD